MQLARWARFLTKLLNERPEVRVTALTRFASQSSWSHEFRRLLELHERRITLLNGDLPSLQLSDAERRGLVEADGGLWHFAASTTLHAANRSAEARIEEVNDGGTARLLGLLAASDRPGPFYHLSTAYVCGRRVGTIHEHELNDAAGFRNIYERSKFAAEVRMQKAFSGGLRGLVFRPSVVASGTPTPGPADVVLALTSGLRAALKNGRRLTLRMPPTAGVNAAAADWLPRALLALARYARTRRTYHLTARNETRIASFATAAQAAGLDVRLRPLATEIELSRGDRLLDHMLRPFRAYFDARVRFDRRNLELDAPELEEGSEIDVRAVLGQRLG